MTLEIFWMLFLLVATLVVFAFELFAIEVTALALLAILLASGVIDLDQAVSGFNNKAMLTIGALFVLSHSLVKTGILEIGANHLATLAARRKWLGVGVFLTIAGLLSGFLNNTAVVAIFIPLAISLCRRLKLSASQVLIPLSYISIMGGMLTLIGTSTNLLVSSLAEEAGQPALGMFEFTALGAIFLVLGLVYTLLFARRLLPERADASSLTGSYGMKAFLTEVKIKEDSPLVGVTCAEARIREEYDITVLSIIRGERTLTYRVGEEKLRAEDLLIIDGAMENALRLRNDQKVALLSDIKLSDRELSAQGLVTVEGLVAANGALVGKTLKDIDFRRKFDTLVLAIRRAGTTLHGRVGRTALRALDTLLIVGTQERVKQLRGSDDILILGELDLALHKGRLWWMPLLLLPVIIALAALGVADILKGSLLGVILLLVLGVVATQEAYRVINWSVLFLIAAFVPVGQAMASTGTAQFIASRILSVSDYVSADYQAHAVLVLIYLVTSLMTQMVSNNAAAIIMTPISLEVAQTLDVNALPFLVTICFAASAEFMTPMGYQTNMMVYGPGNYRFLDYTRFGAPLNIACWLLAGYLIPMIWPF